MRQIHNVTVVQPQSWTDFQVRARRRRAGCTMLLVIAVITITIVLVLLSMMSSEGSKIVTAGLVGWGTGAFSGFVFRGLFSRH